MNLKIAIFVLSLCCASCARSKVDFTYFNLSTNEIWVTEVTGLPREASPGRLAPIPNEGQLSEKSCIYFEPVHIANKLKIVWRDGGKEGWPGGEYTPKGTSHEMEWTREDLGLPATMNSGKVRFTYIGNEKWRVKVLK
jgi:hypothetical protein